MFPSHLKQKNNSETDSTHEHKHTCTYLRLKHNARNNIHLDNAKLVIATPAKHSV